MSSFRFKLQFIHLIFFTGSVSLKQKPVGKVIEVGVKIDNFLKRSPA